MRGRELERVQADELNALERLWLASQRAAAVNEQRARVLRDDRVDELDRYGDGRRVGTTVCKHALTDAVHSQRGEHILWITVSTSKWKNE